MAGANLLNRWGEWVRFGLTITVIVTFSYFDGRYVRVSDWKESTKTITASLSRIETSIVLLQEQSKMLADHESRIRALEFLRSGGRVGQVGQ